MYNVLIVDDEVISRLGITNLINWKNHDCILVDSAENGQQALEIIKVKQIDIVVTDIKMPIMTGIELIDAVKKLGICCEFIVLSSFDDYTYVREALQLGAVDYILKLQLDKDTMLRTLDKAKLSLDEKQKKQTIERVIHNEEIIEETRKNFLKRLLYGTINADVDLKSELNKYKIQMPQRNVCVLFFELDKQDPSLDIKSIMQMIEDVLNDYECAHICVTGYKEFSIIYNFGEASEEKQTKLIRRLANRIIFLAKEYFNLKIFVYVSEIYRNIADISLAYAEISNVIEANAIVTNEPIIFTGQLKRQRVSDQHNELTHYLKGIEVACEQNNKQNIIILIDQIVDEIEGIAIVDGIQMQHFMSTFTYILQRYLEKQYNVTDGMICKDVNGQSDCIKKVRAKKILIQWIKEIKEKIEEIEKQYEGSHIIKMAKHYLAEHCKEPVVLSEVAEKLCVSNTYLSMLFKKETSETLKDYLINLKIDYAKKMLKETNLKISEISSEIAYQNEHYFSRIFKQKTHMTPTQYRNN